MIRGVPNITIPNLNIDAAYGAKMSVPVDSSSLVYSHLEHVSGIAAPSGTRGVSISKLNLLDALISRLNEVSRNGASLAPGLKDGSPDSIIENLANQLRESKAVSKGMPYIRSPGVNPGDLFSLTV